MLAPNECVDGAIAPVGLGNEADCQRTGVQPEHGEALSGGGRLVAIRQPRRRRRLDELDEWLRERFRQHRGNCDVVRQDLLREHGITVSLRTVERAVAPLRQALRAEARACLRFETPPGKQLQIDFGATTVSIGGTACGCICSWRRWLLAATVCASLSTRAAIGVVRRHGGRLPALRRDPAGGVFDNARALVDHHDAATARCVSTNAYTRLRATGLPAVGLRAYRPGPRARMSAASATSSTTPSPGIPLSAGQRSRTSRLVGA